MAGDQPDPSIPGSTERGDAATPRSAPRLDILKALGDNTRYAIYLELARSPLPLATADVADILGLHVNTVRPHLERMREVGLLDVTTDGRGGVGRPQHRYSLSPSAPSLGLEPSPFPTLSRVVLAAAATAGIDPEELADAGRAQGDADARPWPDETPCLDVVMLEQARLGFDPEVVEDDDGATIAFAHCPFRDLAVAHPDLVCALHRGLVEGAVAARAGAGTAADASTDPDGDLDLDRAERDAATYTVRRFHTLLDRRPCQVDLERVP